MSKELSIVGLGGVSPTTNAEFLKLGLEMTGVERLPHVLIIPTAKTTAESHAAGIDGAKKLYEDQLELPVNVLHDFDEMPHKLELLEKIDWADLVYITGGDTDRMMDIWKSSGIDLLLKDHASNGLVITGVSAGAIAPFNWGYSDSQSYRVAEGEPWDYMNVDALGMIKAAITPHANIRTSEGVLRGDAFVDVFAAESELKHGFAIDNKAAIVVNEGYLRAQAIGDRVVKLIELDQDGYSVNIMSPNDYIPLDSI
jgi:dipeptidase E